MNAALDPVGLAADLIRRPSVTPADAGALDVLAGALETVGFTCTRLPFTEAGTPDIANLFARIGTGGRHFCFAGHTDVVPAGDAASWSVDPFGGIVRDGWLLGRGAADMKGAIACFAAAAARFVAARGPDFGGTISLLITGDEEGPAINGTVKMLDWLAAQGHKLDACVVGEPTNARALGDMIKVGRRGSLTGHLTVHGVGGHTAYPHLADNAAHRLVAMLTALTAQPLDGGTGHFQASTLQISTIDVGNPATNVIPATARASFNIRFNDIWSGAGLENWLCQTLDGVGGRYELDVRVSGESFLTPPGAIAELIADAAEAETGRRPEFSTTGGTSDARFINRFCAVAEFGLVGLTMHKADEAVPTADIEALTRIYLGVLERFFAA
ncbi:MAG TPA: succinyl-diaminopimelate desuccinylase [Aliidongia sp.]|uniref:succinyl-diaminopimelate desuccinylase n=1 Tax=Aliidongia sp. TaxID=1914230 RepID=UPI002DDD472C|nr:succinyl-diaminopimelate desuccinylase [Aliidongia sp.]HEV2675801.1 succinyl-diaminopimelate desuccinylase [Aliidongia sp.]